MAETDNPWRHWFRDNRVCGQTLLADFNAAHAGEQFYAGLTIANEIPNSDPARLEGFVEGNGFQGAAFGNNFFNSGQIETQTDATAGQPASNANLSTNATWQAAYDQRAAAANLTSFGGVLAPYRDCKQTDPLQLTNFTNLYRQVATGLLPRSMMPHLPEVNLSSVQALRDRSLLPKAGLSATGILANACAGCHNSTLDQTITRAKFNALDMTRNLTTEFDVAIDRIGRTKEDSRRMPPATHMSLTADEIQTLTQYFQQQKSLRPAP